MLNYMESPKPTTYYTMITGSTTSSTASWDWNNVVYIDPPKPTDTAFINLDLTPREELVKCPFCGSRQKRSNGDCTKCGGDLLNDKVG